MTAASGPIAYAGEPGASGAGTGILTLGPQGLEMFSDIGFAYLWR